MLEKCFYFLLNSSFSGKTVFLRKVKHNYPSTPQPYNNCSAPIFLILFKKFLDILPFKKEGRDYAFYMGDYKWERQQIFYHSVWQIFYLQNCKAIKFEENQKSYKKYIPNIPSHLHISDSNLIQEEFHHIVIKFYHKISQVL